MKNILFALLFLSTTGLLLAGDQTNTIQIVGKTDYDPHSLVSLQVANADEKAGLLWRVYPNKDVHRATTPRGLFQFAAHPGIYDVEVLVIMSRPDGGFDIQEARTQVTIRSCSPPPPGPNPPPPHPQPPVPPTPPPGGSKLDPPNAIGRIQFGNAGCSATVIGPRRADGRWNVVTAAHCNSGVGQSGKITMPLDNKTYNVRVVGHEKGSDLCWMVTEESIDNICYANLAKENPPAGTAVWHKGYGFHLPRNREDGVIRNSETSSRQIQFFLNVSSGDSGGGIFRADTDEWIAAVCCTSIIAQKTDTWGGGVNRARELLLKVADRYSPDPAPKAPDEPPSFPDTSSIWTPLQIPLIK